MRNAVKRVWNAIVPLTAALNDVKEMKMKENESVKEEIDLIEKRIEELTKAQEETIKTRYSIDAEKVSISQFVVERILNNDVDSKSIFILGKLFKDPNKKNAILICRKPEFTDESVKKKFITHAE